MAGKPVSVSFVADTRDLNRGLQRAQRELTDTGVEADQAADKVEKVFMRVTDRADAAATNFSILGGAVGDVAGGVEAFGSKLGISEGVLSKVTEGSELLSTALMFGAGVSDIAAVSGELLNGANLKSTAIKYKDIVATKAKAVAEKAAAIGTKAMAAAQWALNIAMRANPIGLIITALVALGVGFVLLWKKSETFRSIVTGAFNKVKSVASAVFGFVKRVTVGAFNAIVSFAKNWSLPGLISQHIGKIKGFFNGLVSFVKDIPGKIKRAASGMFNGIKDAFKGAINFVIDAWNGLSFTLPSVTVLGKKIGGFTLSTPNIQRLAKGGITTGPTLAMIGDNPGGREAVIPLDKYNLGGGGNTYQISVTAPVGSSPEDVGRVITRYVEAYERAGGRKRAA